MPDLRAEPEMAKIRHQAGHRAWDGASHRNGKCRDRLPDVGAVVWKNGWGSRGGIDHCLGGYWRGNSGERATHLRAARNGGRVRTHFNRSRRATLLLPSAWVVGGFCLMQCRTAVLQRDAAEAPASDLS